MIRFEEFACFIQTQAFAESALFDQEVRMESSRDIRPELEQTDPRTFKRGSDHGIRRGLKPTAHAPGRKERAKGGIKGPLRGF